MSRAEEGTNDEITLPAWCYSCERFTNVALNQGTPYRCNLCNNDFIEFRYNQTMNTDSHNNGERNVNEESRETMSTGPSRVIFYRRGMPTGVRVYTFHRRNDDEYNSVVDNHDNDDDDNGSNDNSDDDDDDDGGESRREENHQGISLPTIMSGAFINALLSRRNTQPPQRMSGASFQRIIASVGRWDQEQDQEQGGPSNSMQIGDFVIGNIDEVANQLLQDNSSGLPHYGTSEELLRTLPYVDQTRAKKSQYLDHNLYCCICYESFPWNETTETNTETMNRDNDEDEENEPDSETNNENRTQDQNQDEEPVCALPCNHWYHWDCCKEWLRQKNACPRCRAELPTTNTDYNEDHGLHLSEFFTWRNAFVQAFDNTNENTLG